ncbi:hypothetical protein FOA52_003282 [Chlamydomonas sp. UWO 241]|nr:hypothetical protein FOA52_003282 [Chlamydomonas sp. UWO 241]
MIGMINTCLESFVSENFGEDAWQAILAESRVSSYPWVTTDAFEDADTYGLVTVAANTLGIPLEAALEAYGVFFVEYVGRQGYSRLLSVLGSNLPEFLNNLNGLHVHLMATFPQMVAPSFRCSNVTAVSLELHYYSQRPLLGPLVIGICKGVAKTHFAISELSAEFTLLRGRDDTDHDVILFKYPHQNMNQLTACYNLADGPCSMHPYHMVFSVDGKLLQWGNVLSRLFPDLRQGTPISELVEIAHPHISFAWPELMLDLHSPFLLVARHPGVGASMCLRLKGSMLQATHAGLPAMVFYGSPRCTDLGELEACRLFLSDLPLHDGSRDYILLAEQRSLEVQLKADLERAAHELKAEKMRSDALVQRMTVLLSCFPTKEEEERKRAAEAKRSLERAAQNSARSGQLSGTGRSEMDRSYLGSPMLSHRESNAGADVDHMEVIESVRRSLAATSTSTRMQQAEDIELVEALSEGTYGKVYRGLWQGTEVAVKTMVLPGGMSSSEKREKMAVMEAAIASTLSHPNIVQTYTYSIRHLREGQAPGLTMHAQPETSKTELGNMGIVLGTGLSESVCTDTVHTMHKGDVGGSGADSKIGRVGRSGTSSGTESGSTIHAYEVRLVLELCEYGSLRDCLDRGAYCLPDSSINFHAVLDTAIDCAKAMVHMHRQSVLHSDLKSRNVMLRSNGRSSAVAKIGDFGLSVQIDAECAYKADTFQGTLTHMAPEILLEGHLGKPADVYAFGIMLWEVYTAKHPFLGVSKQLLPAMVAKEGKRPVFPDSAPPDFVRLTEWCWSADPNSRPTFIEILATLSAQRRKLGGRSPHMRLPDGPPSLDRVYATSSGGGGEDVKAAATKLHRVNAEPPGGGSLPSRRPSAERSRLSHAPLSPLHSSPGCCPMGFGGGSAGVSAGPSSSGRVVAPAGPMPPLNSAARLMHVLQEASDEGPSNELLAPHKAQLSQLMGGGDDGSTDAVFGDIITENFATEYD